MGNSQSEDINLKKARKNKEIFIKYQNKNKKQFLASKKAYAHNDYNGPLRWRRTILYKLEEFIQTSKFIGYAYLLYEYFDKLPLEKYARCVSYQIWFNTRAFNRVNQEYFSLRKNSTTCWFSQRPDIISKFHKRGVSSETNSETENGHIQPLSYSRLLENNGRLITFLENELRSIDHPLFQAITLFCNEIEKKFNLFKGTLKKLKRHVTEGPQAIKKRLEELNALENRGKRPGKQDGRLSVGVRPVSEFNESINNQSFEYPDQTLLKIKEHKKEGDDNSSITIEQMDYKSIPEEKPERRLKKNSSTLESLLGGESLEDLERNNIYFLWNKSSDLRYEEILKNFSLDIKYLIEFLDALLVDHYIKIISENCTLNKDKQYTIIEMAINKAIFDSNLKLHSIIIDTLSHNFSLQTERISKVMWRMAHITPKNLEINDYFTLKKNTIPYQTVIKLLQTDLGKHTDTINKYQIVSKIKEQICWEIDSYYEKYNEEKKVKMIIDADQLLSITSYCIIKSRNEGVFVEMKYMESFISPSLLRIGEDAYYFATFQGALGFILNLREDEIMDILHRN